MKKLPANIAAESCRLRLGLGVDGIGKSLCGVIETGRLIGHHDNISRWPNCGDFEMNGTKGWDLMARELTYEDRANLVAMAKSERAMVCSSISR